jgi:phage tail-like protein
MARSSKAEPVEKFRFKVSFFSLKAPAAASPTSNLAAVIAGSDSGNPEFENPLKNYLADDNGISAGFSKIVPPKANVNTIEYRENNDMNRTTKQVGLVSYEPIVLSRGVTGSDHLYKWYKEVHNDVYDLNKANEVAAAVNWVPVHDPLYRKEIVISVLDREGSAVKHWLCVNCFPISYQGGDSLDASANEKLIEEMTIVYEAFVELKGGNLKEAFADLQQQSSKAAFAAAGAVTIGAIAGGIAGALK